MIFFFINVPEVTGILVDVLGLSHFSVFTDIAVTCTQRRLWSLHIDLHHIETCLLEVNECL